MGTYRPRLLDSTLRSLLQELPAVLITGPRATGKTTTAAQFARTIVRLDQEAEAAAFLADPDAALRGLEEPLLIDEWQMVPSVLGAVKRSVDARPEPGRFLLTGSVRAELDGEWWPGTGRVTRLSMFGMTIAEQVGRVDYVPLLDRIVSGAALHPAADSPDLRGYVDLLLRTGFPEAALRFGDDARRRWLESYVDHLLTRDVEQIEHGRDPARLRRYLDAYASNTAGAVDERTLFDAAGINRKTAMAYERLLVNLFVAEGLPAWTSNRLKRLVLMPKRHLVDAGVAGAVLGLDTNGVMRQGDMLGRLLETFVVSQLRAEQVIARTRARLFHLRQQQGRLEIDVIAEIGSGRLVAIEVKADAAPTTQDARHLASLRDRVGEAFVAGVVLHTGPRTFALGDRLTAVPISTLWAG